MAIVDPNLVSEVNRILGTLVPRAALAGPDLFEVYLFCLILQAARDEGATIYYRDIDNDPVTELIFRISPSYISTKTQRYTHAVIEFPNREPLELHTGIYITGQSGARHECDVAVIYQSEAMAVRNTPGGMPRHRRVLIAVECKYYFSGMGIARGREFLGLTRDIQSKNRFFVTNAEPATVRQLIVQHDGDLWFDDVIEPGSLNLTRLTGTLRRPFQKYKE